MTQDTISSWLSHSDNQSDNPAGPLFIAGAVATEAAMTNADSDMNIITAKTTMSCARGCICC